MTEATLATTGSSEPTSVTPPSAPAESSGKAQGAESTGQKSAAATEGDSQVEVSTPYEKTQEVEEGEEAEKPKFTPRTKVKVMDAEHEVPSWLLKAIDNADTEKEAVELLEKAYGLPHVKENLQTTRRERDEIKTNYQKTMSDIQDVKKTYQRGDIDQFLDKLQIPHERMLQWAVDKVNYSQLPPDQQRVIDERSAAQRKAYAAENQVSSYEQQIQEQARTAKSQLLQSSLVRPDIKTFAEAFDARHGKSGSFLQEVIATGNLAWATSNGKVDLTPDQAIEQVMGKWGKFLQPGQAQQGTEVPVVVPGPGVAAQASSAPKPAVIPNVAGRSTSPMKSKPRSLDELKKLGKEMAANNH